MRNRNNTTIVRIADMAVSLRQDEILTTFALGSCIAVTLYDPKQMRGGMLHFMLPSSRASNPSCTRPPCTYCDTGVPLLIRKMCELGSAKHNLIIKAIGGATLHDDRGIFNIGKRNFEALTTLLNRAGITLAGKDVGGNFTRTVHLHVNSGRIQVVRQARQERVEL